MQPHSSSSSIDILAALNSSYYNSNKTAAAAVAAAAMVSSAAAASTMSNSCRLKVSHKQHCCWCVTEACALLQEHESEQQLSQQDDTLHKSAIASVEEYGIVFIDEIDKIVSSSSSSGRSPDASADGVQRDLLPLLEGTTVSTKHGDVRTDHILFICAGSFHSCKPSDLLAELQGRLPVRIDLLPLTESDLYHILTQTQHNLIAQQTQLIAVDHVQLVFTDAATREIARVAAEVNRTIENIGARRLSTIVERIVSDISYTAPDAEPGTTITVDVDMVTAKVKELMKAADLQKYIL